MPVKGGYDKLPNNQEEPSREKPSLLSLLSFHWMTETFKIGNYRPLEKSDLLPNDEANKTKALTEKLQTLWHDEKEMRQKCGKKPRLWICVCKLLPFKEIFTTLILSMADIICRVLQPLLLGTILSNLTSQNQDKTVMYVCAALLGVTSMGRSLATHLRCWIAEGHGSKLCCALKGIMYAKVTLVGHRTLQEFQEGHVIDLLSNDLQRIELAPRWFSAMIWFIFFTPLILILFLNLFHWEALVGILFLLSLVPYFFFVSFVVGKLRRQTAEVSDKRIALMNELVSGIRAVKTQAREQNYEEKVRGTRRQELSKIREKSLAISTIETMVFCTASTAAFVSVLCLLMNNWQLTPTKAFMLLSFMNLSRETFSVFLGKGFQTVFEATVSLERIQEFLLLEDLPSISSDSEVSESFAGNGDMLNSDDKTNNTLLEEKKKQFEAKKSESELATEIEKKNQELLSHDSEEALIVSNLSYKMIEGEDKYILEDISFVTPRSTLTAICGQVGSGKSTLLCAIAGQLNLSSGTVQYPRPLVYVPQVPWLFSGTIKENILFSAPYNPQWYSTVVEACALKEDIELFPDADETVIGQKGVVLSGGQKARVSLARAVYSRADVYVLDDPLSAVDQKVGDQIFEKCICGLLDDKMTVLVSHHSKYLQKADQIVVLDYGRVKEILAPKVSQTNGADDVLSNSVIGEFENEKGSPHSKSSPGKSQGLEIPEEDRVIGNLSFRLYWDYFRSGLHPVLLIGLIVLSLLIQPAMIFPDIWLSHLSKKTLKQQQKFDNLVIYSSAVAISLVLAISRVALFFLVALRASQRLHDKMVKAVLHAKLLFFDTNPTGRILNRFSRDIGCIDEQLPKFSIICIQYLLFMLSGALIPAFANPWLLLVLFPMLLAFGLFTRYYLKTSRELKRLESICRSPVLSHFSETMAGLDTIRTRGMEEEFVEEFYRHQDVHNQAFIMVFESTRWFGLRADTLCVIFLTCVAFASVGFAMDPAIAGLSLTYVMESLGNAQLGTRYFSEVENFMTSVERVMTYANLESEPGYKTEALPPRNWPRDGHVTFRDVTMTYYEGGPHVLKEMSFTIEGKSRIGVVGRTGAGKSSVVAALLRMPDAQGDVIIDGIRINDINLQASRRCISVLGQIPTLFSGSLRRNIDPMEQHKDANIWAALEDVQLKSFAEGLCGQLDYELLERGANLSVGERQLVCLARTLMQNNRIVILDEPTAHVDPTTEQTIWKTVHEKLKNCTVITIAHRLDTIKNCDLVLVVREGEVAEFGAFDSLVGREGGVLAGIVQTAKDSWKGLVIEKK